MSEFVIITDSSNDANAEIRERYGIETIANRFYYEGKEYYGDPDWKCMPTKDFYDYIRAGNRILTSQISSTQTEEVVEGFLKAGKDVLFLTCPAVLSATAEVARHVTEKLGEKYPERKAIHIDTTTCSGGLIILSIMASKARAEGKTVEETAELIREHKKYINQEGSVESLVYLKRAGRISATAAFFGNLFNVKPMIISDIHGYNVAVEKVKGRKASLIRAVERTVASYDGSVFKDIYVTNADCEVEAEEVKQMLMERLNLTADEVHLCTLNAVIGASVGPGMVGIYYYGKEVTYDSKAGK